MKKTHTLCIAFICMVIGLVNAQEKDYTKPETTEVHEPVPVKVSTEKENSAPSDAIVLFDGTSLDKWVSSRDSLAVKWTLNKDKSVTVKNGSGDIQTCLLYTSPSPRDKRQSRMPSSA